MVSTEERQAAPVEAAGAHHGAPPRAERSPGARLWRNREFNVFWAGQSLSALGDSFALLALPLLVFEATGSVVQMGLVTGTFGIGQVISGLVSGVIVDRVDRRRLMILCDVLRLVLYGSIPLVWLLIGPQLWLIYVVVGFGAMLGMTFSIAYMTALANLVDRDQLSDANARVNASALTRLRHRSGAGGPALRAHWPDRLGCGGCALVRRLGAHPHLDSPASRQRRAHD